MLKTFQPAPRASHTPAHRIAFRHQRAIFVFTVLGLVILFSTAILWGHYETVISRYQWLAKAGLALVDVIAIGLACWHLYAKYAPLKVWCYLADAALAVVMIVHAGAVLQLDSSSAQQLTKVKAAAEAQGTIEAARIKAAAEAAAAVKQQTSSSMLASRTLRAAQPTRPDSSLAQMAAAVKPETFLSEEYLQGGVYYWPALIALFCFFVAIGISSLALPYEDANRNGVPDYLERSHSIPLKIAPGFVAPAQASIPRPRRYVRSGPDATARVVAQHDAAPLDALSEKLAKLGAVDPVNPPTDPPARAVKGAAPVGEINPPTNPPTDHPEAGGWPELPGIQWEHKRDGVVEAWYAPEGGRNRAGKTYLGRIGKRQLGEWQTLAPKDFLRTVCEWVEQKRADKL